jgi:hypothetical protein
MSNAKNHGTIILLMMVPLNGPLQAVIPKVDLGVMPWTWQAMYGNGSMTGGRKIIIPIHRLIILKDLVMEHTGSLVVVPGLMNGGAWIQRVVKVFNLHRLECTGSALDVLCQQNDHAAFNLCPRKIKNS